MLRAFICALLFGLFFADIAGAQSNAVGVIQYNVKNHQGGWISDALTATIKFQAQLIAYQVKARANQDPPVDFIALEQSELKGKNFDRVKTDGNIANLLKGEGLPNWKLIWSQCQYDITQLAYSPDWELVTGPGLTNPLVNSKASPQNGWVDCSNDGRPYNIAYFNNKKTSLKVLFIITHMPHCRGGDFDGCIKSWRVPQLSLDIRRVVGKAKLKQTNFIMAGDMNEFGGSNKGSTFDPIFSDFGTLQISSDLQTCCADSNFIYRYDRLLTNSSTSPTTELLTYVAAGKEITYPLDPKFLERTGRKNEEHKAIFGVVKF